ncbi:MAG TPA: ParB/RepB/Spo0J family partition protein [Patescibacteria group bacterium]|nr:ParB/RepB/Spo0J family partition protein [Patescibacteria group bacterium]
MSMKPALGRGLSSLIPQKASDSLEPNPVAGSLLEIPVEAIQPNSRQPRLVFEADELEALADSVRIHGILMPLVVRKVERGYELIAGERRLRAAKLAGLETVPAVLRDADEKQRLELALIENVQRQDLNAVEEAEAYRALVGEFGLTQEEVAKRMGKSRSEIANTLRLLDLPNEMRQAVAERKISKSHARTLLSEPDAEKRAVLFSAMLRGELTVRGAEKVAATSKRHSVRLPRQPLDPNLADHEKRLRERFGTMVRLRERGGTGSVEIFFYAKEDLAELLRKLEGG